MFTEYGKLSTMLYEFTKPAGTSIDGDLEYYLEKLQGTSGRILEAGVGTGRLLIPLLGAGLTVDGVDISAEMLAQCRQNLQAHQLSADLFEQDLTKLNLPEHYQAIVMPTGSFCLLPKAKIAAVLAAFYQQLTPGGQLIVDLEMPSDFHEGTTDQATFPLDDHQGIMMTNYHEKIDWFNQKTSTLSKYELITNGAVTATELSHFIMYWYGLNEFEMLLQAAGFSEISHEIGYGKHASEIITFIARKA
ncbi:class I SAM-dependent methyltransferase [Lapidilactobacillus wuchangensis]|uniref:class I SAM-dependent methyltransferase n=1 Tax=Lapidilactobacillus wuchangensis TaxID=2486001 RepID=UPI000F7999C4|nr:class I SAM-dependent methyltransferase [Lapidilactobacillus wuchangensis]